MRGVQYRLSDTEYNSKFQPKSQVNAKMFSLPNPVPGKDNSEPKRPQKALDISKMVKLVLMVPNKICVKWASSSGKGAFVTLFFSTCIYGVNFFQFSMGIRLLVRKRYVHIYCQMASLLSAHSLLCLSRSSCILSYDYHIYVIVEGWFSC